MLLGTGIAKIPEVIAELRRQKFGGLVAVEYTRRKGRSRMTCGRKSSMPVSWQHDLQETK